MTWRKWAVDLGRDFLPEFGAVGRSSYLSFVGTVRDGELHPDVAVFMGSGTQASLRKTPVACMTRQHLKDTLFAALVEKAGLTFDGLIVLTMPVYEGRLLPNVHITLLNAKRETLEMAEMSLTN